MRRWCLLALELSVLYGISSVRWLIYQSGCFPLNLFISRWTHKFQRPASPWRNFRKQLPVFLKVLDTFLLSVKLDALSDCSVGFDRVSQLDKYSAGNNDHSTEKQDTSNRKSNSWRDKRNQADNLGATAINWSILINCTQLSNCCVVSWNMKDTSWFPR